MGEISNNVTNGLVCDQCGGWMPEVEEWMDMDDIKAPLDNPFINPPGHPRTCPECKEEQNANH